MRASVSASAQRSAEHGLREREWHARRLNERAFYLSETFCKLIGSSFSAQVYHSFNGLLVTDLPSRGRHFSLTWQSKPNIR